MDKTVFTLQYVPVCFVNRKEEAELVMVKLRNLMEGRPVEKRAITFTGERGTGKTWLLAHLKTLLSELTDVIVLHLNLKDYGGKDPSSAVAQIIREVNRATGGLDEALGVELAEMSRRLMARLKKDVLSTKVLVLLLDHAHESDWELLSVLEDYLVGPLITMPRVLIVMTGRGWLYPWKTPELRLKGEFVDLKTFRKEDTEAQVKRQVPEPRLPSEKVYQLSANETRNRTFRAFERAGLVVEPLVQGAAGMRMYRAAALKRMRDLCDEHGVHLILDCVAVAFGRTGRMFASEHAGISPDIMAVAKGLTGGMVPLAATLATEEIFEGFLGDYTEDRKLAHGHSFTGNPLAAACAVASLKVFEEEAVLDNVGAKSSLLKDLWNELAGLAHVTRVRTMGMIAALDLEEDPSSAKPYPPEARIGKKIAAACLDMGLFVRPLGDTMYLLPPLAIDTEEIRLAVSAMEKAIAEVTGKG